MASRENVIEALGATFGDARLIGQDQAGQRYNQNLTEFPAREIVCGVQCRTPAEVQMLVGIARQFKTPLYPISTGCNWGLGSRLPVADGCILVDLSPMDRIREIDVAGRCAVIEPGVTQHQLAKAVSALDAGLKINPTGSGKRTSVLANTLERGMGKLRQRSDDLRGLEAVLGTGEILRTGYWGRFENAAPGAASHYPPGLGPDPTGLFLQSSFGIVTAVVIDLLDDFEFDVVHCRCPEQKLGDMVSALSSLRRYRVLADGIQIDSSNDPRNLSLPGGDGTRRDWVLWTRIEGLSSMRDAAREEVNLALSHIGLKPTFYRRSEMDNPDLPEVIRADIKRTAGRPVDFSIRAMARAGGVTDPAASFDPDADAAFPGMACALIAVPFDGARVLDLLARVDASASEFAIDVACTFSAISATAFEGFIRTYFDRREPSAINTAHQWNHHLHHRLIEAGIYPYRLNVEEMAQIFDGTTSTLSATLEEIKNTLDPDRIIAPGRYSVGAGP